MTRLEHVRAQLTDPDRDSWLPNRHDVKLLVDLAEAFDRYEATWQGPEYMACRAALDKLREPV